MSNIIENKLEYIPHRLVRDDEMITETFYNRICKTIVHSSDLEDIDTQDQMNIVEVSGTLDFWNDQEEDIDVKR